MAAPVFRLLGEVARGALRRPTATAEPFSTSYRCWPIGMDCFGHKSNVSYFTIAELARWQLQTSDGVLKKMHDSGTWFWIAEQTCSYRRPIMPFESYDVRVTAAAEGNVMRYDFVYESAAGEHATVAVRGKFKNGRATVAPLDFAAGTTWHAAQLGAAPARPEGLAS